MAVTSKRNVAVTFIGDLAASNTFAAAANTSSPGTIQLVKLTTGVNTITPPIGAVACTIIPLSTNTVVLTLKGVAGDTGIALHLTDPTSIGLGATVASFVINAASGVTVRLFWS